MPFTDFSAGRVMRPPMTAAHRTALTGVLVALTFDQSREPGTARSRLKANIIREVDVRQAVAQNNWAHEAMKSRSPAQFDPSDSVKMYRTPPAGIWSYAGAPSTFGIANVTAS